MSLPKAHRAMGAALLLFLGGCCCCGMRSPLKEATQAAIDQQDKVMEHQKEMMDAQKEMIRSFPGAQPQPTSDGLQVLRTDVQKVDASRTLTWQATVDNPTPFQYFRGVTITVYDKDGVELFSDTERDTISPKAKLTYHGEVEVTPEHWDQLETWEFRIGR